MEVKVLLPGVKYKFIFELFELFDSNEPREREYVKNIIHRLYGKLV
jgi:serine/threonine-protein phosphatase 2A regulatory subunit B'